MAERAKAVQESFEDRQTSTAVTEEDDLEKVTSTVEYLFTLLHKGNPP